jgi:hypothetical protein
MNLVECAAREIGDDALAARLSTEAGVASLGPYGQQTAKMPRLDRALACASTTVGSLLQSSTRFSLTVSGGFAKWTYSVTDPIEIGRQKNEMLAFGYMLDLIRCFARRQLDAVTRRTSGATPRHESRRGKSVSLRSVPGRSGGDYFPGRSPRRAEHPAAGPARR